MCHHGVHRRSLYQVVHKRSLYQVVHKGSLYMISLLLIRDGLQVLIRSVLCRTSLQAEYQVQ